jgi:hypothetical protein
MVQTTTFAKKHAADTKLVVYQQDKIVIENTHFCNDYLHFITPKTRPLCKIVTCDSPNHSTTFARKHAADTKLIVFLQAAIVTLN